jgi:uncharacterized protein YhaN
MRIITIGGEVLPVLGTIGLLGLWLFQQNGVEQRSAELQKLAAARNVFQTYQSHNALFNAIHELTSTSKKGADQVRVFQILNYEQGLTAIEEALPDPEKTGIPPPTAAYSAGDLQSKIKQTQTRLEKLQERLAERKTKVQQSVDTAKKTYLWCYVGLSVLAILGAACKVFEKFSATALNKTSPSGV